MKIILLQNTADNRYDVLLCSISYGSEITAQEALKNKKSDRLLIKFLEYPDESKFNLHELLSYPKYFINMHNIVKEYKEVGIYYPDETAKIIFKLGAPFNFNQDNFKL